VVSGGSGHTGTIGPLALMDGDEKSLETHPVPSRRRPICREALFVEVRR
jgi:hypothetical protein